MTTTNHTSPCGEDAANVAIGEREAFDQWFKTRGVWPRLTYLEIWQASRAALTAEKVAAEPVIPERLPGEKFSEWAKRTYESQPQPAQSAEQGPDFSDGPDSEGFSGPRPWNGFAQSAEQDERVTQWQSRVRNVSRAEWINITEEGAATIREKYSDAYELRALFDRAASTQSTATQPVQAQVALTKEMIGAAWRDCGSRSVSPPEWALQFAQSIARALLAAQPLSGGEA